MKILTFIFTLLLFSLTGCSSRTEKHVLIEPQNLTKAMRIEQLNQLENWQVSGKIAFITTKQRDSFSLNWQHQGNTRSQILNLTSYLGIQALSLTSQEGQHIVNLDGKEYRSDNLNELIYSLTGLTLPTQAMTLWLKGLALSESDIIHYDSKTQLPSSMLSYYNQQAWSITYGGYEQINQYQLATKLTIKKDDLIIKIRIHQWND